jgi:monoamine oxidase
MPLTRRALLAAALPLAACSRRGGGSDAPAGYTGGWVGTSPDRGHRLRARRADGLPAPALQRRAGVVVVGAGIAGLAAARVLRQAGVDDVQVLDLEDAAGGNSRGHRIAGMACPLGAHYLPVPGEQAEEVVQWLDEIGVRRHEGGRVVYDERQLCHSPQERLYIDGAWHEGLLPPVDALPAAERATTLAQYRQFAQAVAEAARGGAFAMPTARARWNTSLDALDAVSFAAWLDAQGLQAPALRWYLDYCCRDDYGAGAAQVSAWAGLHYFASRHGFHAPGEADEEREPVLTWPEGNAWLAAQLSAPLGTRLHTGQVALAVQEDRHGASVDVWNVQARQLERWSAPQLVLATPLFVAARLLAAPPSALQAVQAQQLHAPWLVANLHLADALTDRYGAAPSWDNVRYGSASLGYVDAMHQSTRSHAGATVLTSYWALGGDSAAQLQAARAQLLAAPWADWAARVVQDLAVAHPDLPARVRQVDITRHGHAMAVPTPGMRRSAALQELVSPQRRVHFAHTDLSGYSVFEEAMFQGARCARQVLDAFETLSPASALRSRRPPPARRG